MAGSILSHPFHPLARLNSFLLISLCTTYGPDNRARRRSNVFPETLLGRILCMLVSGLLSVLKYVSFAGNLADAPSRGRPVGPVGLFRPLTSSTPRREYLELIFPALACKSLSRNISATVVCERNSIPPTHRPYLSSNIGANAFGSYVQ
jgi:hypothetical protein